MGERRWVRGAIPFSAAVLAAIALLTGCDGQSQAAPGTESVGGSAAVAGSASTAGAQASTGGGAPAAAEDYAAALANGYCARLFRCFEGNDDFIGARLLLKTPEGCEAAVRKAEEQAGRRDLRAQLAAGGLRYDAVAAAKCIAELSACNGTDAYEEGSCREVYEGSQEVGQACQRAEDCAGDAYCESDGFTCPGLCQPRKAEGAPCELSADCAYTGGVVFCDRDNAASPVCRTLPAAPKKAAFGEPCTRDLTGSTVLLLCEDHLWCGADGAAPHGRCIAPLKLGEPCTSGDDVCLDSLCDATAGVCAKVTLRSNAGESCSDDELTACDATLGLRCNDQGTCIGSGDGSEGTDCFNGDFQRGCATGLYCAPDDTPPAGTCTRWLATGAPCERDVACESGNCNGTCQARYCAP